MEDQNSKRRGRPPRHYQRNSIEGTKTVAEDDFSGGAGSRYNGIPEDEAGLSGGREYVDPLTAGANGPDSGTGRVRRPRFNRNEQDSGNRYSMESRNFSEDNARISNRDPYGNGVTGVLKEDGLDSYDRENSGRHAVEQNGHYSNEGEDRYVLNDSRSYKRGDGSRYEYDADNRRQKAAQAGSCYEYDADGRRQQAAQDSGRYEYDADGRRQQAAQAGSRYEYDADGRRQQGAQAGSRYEYDAEDRRRQGAPDGSRYEYDMELRQRQAAPAGSRYEYDAERPGSYGEEYPERNGAGVDDRYGRTHGKIGEAAAGNNGRRRGMTTRGRGGQSAGRKSSGRRRPGDRKKNRWLVPLVIILVVADLIFMLIFGIRHWLDKRKNESPLGPAPEQEQIEGEMPEEGGDGETGESGEPAGEDGGSAPSEEEMGQLFAQSDRMAMHYDYDGAIELINSSPFAQNPEAQSRIESYEATKATLVPANNSEITHVFFHILIVDPELALTDDPRGEDFNQVMTSIPEFEAILSEMYARGYVLVGLHDIAEIQKDENGQEHMVQKQIMLPEGKKPFVMSQDDVCYYEYMEGCGFADKMVLDENGKLKLQYTERDGTVSIGDYDLVPILDRFVEEHPDFSYHGHKAIIAFTGYNGVLGYRTDESYDPNSGFYDPNNTPNENLEADRQTVRELTRALVEDGYELSSHSWGHVNFTTRDLAALTKDTDRWERNVESLLPAPCDILLYPFGADIKDWHPYDHGNEKFNMLEAAGFRYFCNVDSNEYWVQFGDNFMRQGRRNLDGYRLYEAYSGGKNRVSDLMDVTKVFDTRRPVPIGWKD